MIQGFRKDDSDGDNKFHGFDMILDFVCQWNFLRHYMSQPIVSSIQSSKFKCIFILKVIKEVFQNKLLKKIEKKNSGVFRFIPSGTVMRRNAIMGQTDLMLFLKIFRTKYMFFECLLKM